MQNNEHTSPSIRFISLGCPKNLVDSEVMAGLMQKEKLTLVASDQTSDVCVVNTCGFIEDSKQESINTILEVAKEKQNGSLKVLVVAGCLVQRYTKDLPNELPEVDAFIGTGDFNHLSQVVRDKLGGLKKRDYIGKPHQLPQWDTPRIQTTPFYSRYVKISEGCSHACSFCTIPMMRGGLKSRPVDDVFLEIEKAIENNVKEFNLIAQDLNEYGRDLNPRSSLFSLLTKLEELKGHIWLRPLYMYPLQFPDRLIQLMKDHPHLVPYVDIPLQHIDDGILKSMKRGSSSKYIYRLIEGLRKNIPNIVLRTTFITGYPGETDKEFQKLHHFIKEIQFDHLGVFTYSLEEDTPSYSMPDHVDESVKNERRHTLMETQKNISQKINQKYIGQRLQVLFEGEDKEADNDRFQNGIGRFYGQAPDIDGQVLFSYPQTKHLKPGDFVDVKISDAFAYDLVGEIVPDELQGIKNKDC